MLAGQRPLFTASDHGHAIKLDPELFGARQQGGGWGPAAESFLRMNERLLSQLDVRVELRSSSDGPHVFLFPGANAGAVPLRSATTGHVIGGLVVRPRFGWAGVGRVLSNIGWHAAPALLEAPMVPGSGREVPPWVLAGPAVARLAELLRNATRGYREHEEVLSHPRGRILWPTYVSRQLARGAWHQLPCRFPDLTSDLKLRRYAKWTLGRIHRDLTDVIGRDPLGMMIATIVARLLEDLRDVHPLIPHADELKRALASNQLATDAIRRGIEAMAWIVEERGLGGGREMDGLAWRLSLSELWEQHVEAVVRAEAALVGADVKSGRLGQTTFPLVWGANALRSITKLVPDIVVRRGSSITIVDAKYKAHFAELDEAGWRAVSEDVRETHREDVHQALAYAALFDADEVTTRLVYPLRITTWRALAARRRDVARAQLLYGGRRLSLEFQGLPFGSADGCWE